MATTTMINGLAGLPTTTTGAPMRPASVRYPLAVLGCLTLAVVGHSSPAQACSTGTGLSMAPPTTSHAAGGHIRVPANAKLWIETFEYGVAEAGAKALLVDGEEVPVAWELFDQNGAVAELPPTLSSPPRWTWIPREETTWLAIFDDPEIIAIDEVDTTPPEWLLGGATGEAPTIVGWAGSGADCYDLHSVVTQVPHAFDDFGLAGYALIDLGNPHVAVGQPYDAPRVLRFSVEAAQETWFASPYPTAFVDTGFIAQENLVAGWETGLKAFLVVAVDFAGNVSRSGFLSPEMESPTVNTGEYELSVAETPLAVIELFEGATDREVPSADDAGPGMDDEEPPTRATGLGEIIYPDGCSHQHSKLADDLGFAAGGPLALVLLLGGRRRRSPA